MKTLLAEIFLGVLAAYVFWMFALRVHGQAPGSETSKSTYFAWRTPTSHTWLAIVSYDGNDPRHDHALIEDPSTKTDICVRGSYLDNEQGELFCRSTAEVAQWLTQR